MNAVPPWLELEITQGLHVLYALRLPNTPAIDVLEQVVQSWSIALVSKGIAWHAASDTPRIRRTFAALLSSADKWPSPAQFFFLLPMRPPQKLPLLPHYPTPAQQAQRKQKMQDLANRLTKQKAMP